MNQPSFLSIAHAKKLRCERFLDEMTAVVPWDALLAEVMPHCAGKATGRRRTDALLLLKLHFLQQWYGLSDPGVEEAVYDRNSFQKFLGIDLLADRVPDETTILNFRRLLEAHGLQERFFAVVVGILEGRGLLMRNGTIVDATIIAAPPSTKNRERRRDPDMGSTQKNGAWYFGMKAHIGVDSASGLVHTVAATSASVSDRAAMSGLFHGRERAKFGDKGYVCDADKREARKSGVFWGVLDKGRINHPLSASQKRRNRKMSSVRSAVEHPFRVLKRQFGYVRARYRGLRKNALQLNALFALANLYKVRRVLAVAV